MAHIIFDLKNDRAITRPYGGIHQFNSPRGAKTSLSALLRRTKRVADEFMVVTREYFDEYLDPMVETTNILGTPGNIVMIRKSEKGGCTDPGTERYHCM